ncbi:MAG: hypothetical protein ABIL25_07740 [candidate division WOR-3 bacterium]
MPANTDCKKTRTNTRWMTIQGRLMLTGLLLAVGTGLGASRGVAIVASAALPGAGQLMLGARNRGEAMLWVDGAGWLAWAGFSWYGSSREQDARLVAAREAGADITLRESRYYTALERYDNADEYNEDVRREARSRFPDDPVAQHEYYEENGYFGEKAWDWSSDSARYYFWRTRRSARAAAQRAGFTAAGLLLNRLASVLDCAFFLRSPQGQSRLEIGPGEDVASLELRYRF